jgi:hypothetical protein
MSRKEDQRMGENASPDEGHKLGNRVNHREHQKTAMHSAAMVSYLTINIPN